MLAVPLLLSLFLPADTPKARSFQLTYAATVTGLEPGQVARIWLPVPPTNDDQDARTEEVTVSGLPTKMQTDTEKQYGNLILYCEAKAAPDGTLPVRATYRVTRREVKGDGGRTIKDDTLTRFLQPDAKVPIDGKPLELLRDRKVPADQMQAAQMLYDVVSNHMRYSKDGTGWGQGDAVWACDSKRGNCSDFHSLFISLARSQKIPATFEIGFSLPEKRGEGEIAGYHCWAKFRPTGRDWVPVDISEANKNPKLKDYYFGNLTEDRVAFSTGRDLTLVPKQDGPAINFFISPYVEVGGKPYAAEKVKLKVTYRDER